jgi:uncharacterized protein YdeI (YjbR/CyaY-like superfamily)
MFNFFRFEKKLIMKINPLVDKYLIDGCMRCKYGATPQCKVHKWTDILKLLRKIILEQGLEEEIKWGIPVYTKNGKNIVNISALKDSALLGFFKGALLSDGDKVLERQGNIQSSRIIRFYDVEKVIRLEQTIRSYIHEAIVIEEHGLKLDKNQKPEPTPEELIEAFEEDPDFEEAFNRLTPGRQRAYLIHFAQPKRSETRRQRIEKYKPQILSGVGLHDKYSS